MLDASFYSGRKVLITGHTGFKGSWLSKILLNAGADVVGYSLDPPTKPSLFEILGIGRYVNSIHGDVRDFAHLKKTFDEEKPDIVIHMAAQPLVRESYANPMYTYETNVMGTVNVMECARECETARSILNVTTDKVYLNREWEWGYRECDELDGYDPYSNSKSCSELVTHCYKRSFFDKEGVAVSTARAGNVIGGGDYAKDRIVPDCVRAAKEGRDIVVRNPNSVRPYQHVLEPLGAYLMIAAMQYDDAGYADCYNVGPDDSHCFSTAELVEMFVGDWGGGVKWISEDDGGPHEATYLKLDCSKLKDRFGWKPKWTLKRTVEATVEFEKIAADDSEGAALCVDRQIADFFGEVCHGDV